MKKTLTLAALICSIATANAHVNPSDSIHVENQDTISYDKSLDNVVVVAQKPIVKMKADKVEYSVADDPESKTTTVLDMLRKVPMVTVDGQDNITVNGSGSFKVYVDGKPNAMMTNNASQIFKAMPASAVKSIEVITNPGAKYDAEGAGGVLDIKMAGGSNNQSVNGYNGSLSANGGNSGWGLSGYLAGQQNKWSYNAYANYRYIDNGKVDVEMIRKQNDGSTMNCDMGTDNTMPYINTNLSLGYEIDSLNSVNLSAGYTSYKVNNVGDPTTELLGGSYGKGFSYGSHSETINKSNFFNGSFDYQHFFNANRSSSLTFTYQLNVCPGSNTSDNTFNKVDGTTTLVDLTNRYSDGNTNTVENIAQVDLVTPLSKVSTLSSGVKYSNRKSTSDTDYYLAGKYQDAMSSDYKNIDQVGAVYAELDNHWEKFSAKAGLRYEHTWQSVTFYQGNGSDFTKNYGNLVPTASLSYMLKPGKSIGLNYNMRISRPGISYLNPYVDQSDPTALSYGNPDLTVEKSHNISGVFNYYTPKLMMTATLRQTFDNGGIEQYSFYEGNVMNTTYGNIVDRKVTSLNVFVSWLIFSKTRLIINAAGSYNDLRSDMLNRCNYGFQGNGMIYVQQEFKHKWNLGFGFITGSKTYKLQGTNSGMNIASVSLSKSFFKDKLNIGINAITGLSKGGKLHLDQYTEGKDFTSQMNIAVPLTRVMATVTWKFGNTAKQFQQHQSKVDNNYIEQKNSSESIGNVGSGM